MPYLLLFIGRFHPIVLHFPIVLIVLALILEIMRRSSFIRGADTLVLMILIAAVASALLAISSGFLLYSSGDYSGALMNQHFWIGVITGICILFTSAFFIFYRNNPRLYPLYLAGLVISNGAVAFASHLGGSVTHGEDYLTEYIPMLFSKAETKEPVEQSEMLVYDHVMAPIFDAKCNSCHNDSRSKGELSMTSYEKIVKGGESEIPGIVPGIPDSSEIYKRIILPEGHADRMPPEGKAPLTENETLLLHAWIKSGAKKDMMLQQLSADTGVKVIVDDVIPTLSRYERRRQIAAKREAELEKELGQLEMELNIEISRDTAADGDYYMVSMKFPPASLTGRQLNRLDPFADVFSRLSLVSSGIEDDGLYHISKMSNVTALYLQKTRIRGNGLIHLQKLDKLEELNLSYTNVDDKSLIDLLKVPNLRKVYVFQTKASPEMIKALQQYRPGWEILAEEGPYK